MPLTLGLGTACDPNHTPTSLNLVEIKSKLAAHLSRIVAKMFGTASLTSYQPPTSSKVRQWEEAGASLVNSLSKYLDLSFSLESDAQQEGMHPKELGIRIDSALATLHVIIHRQISQARSTLMQTRNRIMSPISSLPEEVLSTIFAHTIFTPTCPADPASMKESLSAIYRATHSILAVCTIWRKIVLSRGSFWSIIPILETESSYFSSGYPQAMALSLERAKNTKLYLAAILSNSLAAPLDLSQYAAQVCSINIACTHIAAIGHILSNLWAHGSSMVTQISDISLRHEFEEASEGALYGVDQIFSFDSPERVFFEKILKTLSTLRLRGVSCHWKTVAFCDRLVEVHLQDFCVGFDSDMAGLMIALSSATKLRDLKLVSVKTFPDRETTQGSLTGATIELPSLENLLVRDLYANTLESFLSSITSRSHRLTLHLTVKTIQVIDAGEFRPAHRVYVEDLVGLFNTLSIHTLLLHQKDEQWILGSVLGKLLLSMPELEILRINNGDFNDELCRALCRPHVSPQPFPQLKAMYFTRARLWNEQSFREVVESHSASLKKMVLGGLTITHKPSDGHYSYLSTPLERGNEIVLWLEETVPDFKLVDGIKEPPEFQSVKWQLW